MDVKVNGAPILFMSYADILKQITYKHFKIIKTEVGYDTSRLKEDMASFTMFIRDLQEDTEDVDVTEGINTLDDLLSSYTPDTHSKIYRRVLQVIGSDIIRKIDDYYFIDNLHKNILEVSNKNTIILIDDLRFMHEYLGLTKLAETNLIDVLVVDVERTPTEICDSMDNNISEEELLAIWEHESDISNIIQLVRESKVSHE
jgi:hypothetical protein